MGQNVCDRMWDLENRAVRNFPRRIVLSVLLPDEVEHLIATGRAKLQHSNVNKGIFMGILTLKYPNKLLRGGSFKGTFINT